MSDYGRPLQFGIFPSPDAGDADEVLEPVLLADELGLDLAGIQDHPYQARHLDAWTLLAVAAARTRRVRLFLDVADLPLRPPAMLAKAAASLDVLTGGRVEVGLGAGAFWDGIAAMGGARRTPGEAVAAVEEAVAVCRAMWSGERSVRVEGRHYGLAGVHPGPAPAHPIGIWLGAIGPRMLALTGRSADGWVPSTPFVPPEKLADAHARIDEAATAAGRDPAQVQRVYNVFGSIDDRSGGFLHGPPAQWVDELTGLVVERGMDSFVFGPDGGDPVTQIRRFAEEVAPGVRDAVAEHRGTD
ncbi:LLM class flavin-dependent oxidoreductase [Pseudonocardia sp. C8]|uniref:LLM class flavin-dependent oxidoreductase n=1 Tax=Pseudonocardia sp. C8 TaxID=2762759 RepID=UPI001643180C|nr:LLM class flavin-dependent oxidoreductase [Pseudonocardia sp. C8]MBC3189656.1 LLM class flavin-dependent oxidoreductase [Pseudonocardia sp. C8]